MPIVSEDVEEEDIQDSGSGATTPLAKAAGAADSSSHDQPAAAPVSAKLSPLNVSAPLFVPRT